MDFAAAMRRDEGAETNAGAYTATTRAGANPAMAVIMVAGGDANETSGPRDSRKQKIAGIKKFDLGVTCHCLVEALRFTKLSPLR